MLSQVQCPSNKSFFLSIYMFVAQLVLPVIHHIKKEGICGKSWRISCLLPLFFFFFCTANTSAVWLSVLLESVLLSLGACHSSPCHCLCILSFNSIHVKVCVCVCFIEVFWGFSALHLFPVCFLPTIKCMQ